jgi:hypothetical protein
MIQTWVAVFNAPKKVHNNITWDMQKHCEFICVIVCITCLFVTMFFQLLCTGNGFSAAVIYVRFLLQGGGWRWVDM